MAECIFHHCGSALLAFLKSYTTDAQAPAPASSRLAADGPVRPTLFETAVYARWLHLAAKGIHLDALSVAARMRIHAVLEEIILYANKLLPLLATLAWSCLEIL